MSSAAGVRCRSGPTPTRSSDGRSTISSRRGSPRTPPRTATACGAGSRGLPRDLLRRPAAVRTRARALRHLGGDLPRDDAHPRRRGAGVARSDGDRPVAGPAPRGARTRSTHARAVREVALACAARRPRPLAHRAPAGGRAAAAEVRQHVDPRRRELRPGGHRRHRRRRPGCGAGEDRDRSGNHGRLARRRQHAALLARPGPHHRLRHRPALASEPRDVLDAWGRRPRRSAHPPGAAGGDDRGRPRGHHRADDAGVGARDPRARVHHGGARQGAGRAGRHQRPRVARGVAAAAPLVSPWDPLKSVEVDRLSPPGTPGHLLGTDEQGRDILSRLIWGGRISLLVGIVPTVAAGIVALLLGLVAGYREGLLDHLIMRVLDVFFAFPLVLLAIAIVGVIGPGVGNQMFALAVVLAPYSTRVVRTATLSVKPLEFVEAVRALGAGSGRVLWRHLVPNVLPPLLVYTSTLVGLMIVASSGLSFLGLGVQPPTPDWGVMVGSGRLVIYRAAHVATIPGVIIVVVALGFNFIGDGLREALDPRARQ